MKETLKKKVDNTWSVTDQHGKGKKGTALPMSGLGECGDLAFTSLWKL